MMFDIKITTSRPNYLPGPSLPDSAPFYLCMFGTGFTWNLESLVNLDSTIETCICELQRDFKIFDKEYK